MAKKNPKVTIDDEPLIKGDDASEEGEAQGEEQDEEGDEEDEDEDGDGTAAGGDEDDEDAEKSDVTEADLVKAMNGMDGIVAAAANGISPRQQQLAAKLASGTKLTKSEHAELADSGEPMAKSHKESFVENPQIAQGFEVSEFLDAALTKVAESLDDNRTEMTKSFAEVGEFNRTLAKSLNALGAVVVAQAAKIRKLEKSLSGEQPRQAPQAAAAKGVTGRSSVGQKVNDGGAIRKSGNGNAGVTLSKGMILDTLDDAIAKSDGQRGVVDGIDLVLEASRYETTQLLSPDAMRLVCKARGIDPTSLGLNG
jgi:hypothetical protein